MMPTITRCWLVLAVCGAVLGGAGSAAAQRAFDLSRFYPALDADGFIGVQGTRTPGPDSVTLGLFTDYASDLLHASIPSRALRAASQTEDHGADIVAHRFGGTLSIEGGVGGRVALGLTMPMVFYQDGDRLAGQSKDLPASALGDPWLHARYRVFGDSSGGVNQHRDGPGVALQLSTALPVTGDDAFAGEHEPRLHAQLLGDMHLLGAGIGASLGWLHRFEGVDVYDVRVHDALTFGAGLELPIPPLFPLSGLLEFRGATDFRSARTTALEGEIGARLRFESGVVLTLAGGMGFGSGLGTPDARVIAGVWFTPRTADSDQDGIPDTQDQCPPLPEDFDGFQDADGCPDPDNDNDLVPDVDDLCPNQEALEGRDDDEDGCTDK
jgi:hypothetical protein